MKSGRARPIPTLDLPMNTYDFDGTIYSGDSTVDFSRYAIKRHPALLRYLPIQLVALLLWCLGLVDKTYLKEKFFVFFRGIDAEALVEEFWKSHEKKIFPWYPPKHKDDDILLSASPEFLLKPICRRLGIKHLIASRVDPKTGRFAGKNDRGAEKVKRLAAEFGVTHVDEFYSDSRADTPMARIADRAFLIRGGEPVEWTGL